MSSFISSSKLQYLLSGRPQPIAEEEDSFYGVDAQNFYAAERDAQPDRRQAPSSGDFAGAASNNDDGFGPFFGNGNFQSGPVSAAAAPGESLEEILAKKNKATPERPGFTPPKLIERFSSPVVEPSISYNQPQPQVTSFCWLLICYWSGEYVLASYWSRKFLLYSPIGPEKLAGFPLVQR